MRPAFELLKLFLVVLFAGIHATANAQTYPTNTIRMVVPFTAGGGVDILARLVAERLRERWGQPVLVENRPGASGVIGTDYVAKATPDGHTLLMGYDGTLVISPLLGKVPFDTLRDLAPVTKVTDVPLIIVAHPSFQANSIRELISLAKAKPGQLNYSSSGTGSTPHMVGELIESLAGIDMLHVPYKGGSAALIDTLGGQMQLLFIAVPPVQSYVTQGRLKAIAVTTAKRTSALPNVPTVAESGLSGFDVPTWFGIMAPKGTPRPIVLKIQQEVASIITIPAVKERFATLGFEPVGNTPDEFEAQIKADIARWSKVVAQANIKTN